MDGDSWARERATRPDSSDRLRLVYKLLYDGHRSLPMPLRRDLLELSFSHPAGRFHVTVSLTRVSDGARHVAQSSRLWRRQKRCVRCG